MKNYLIGLLGLGWLVLANAGVDFQCMESCVQQGRPQQYCAGVCNASGGGGGMLNQPGLPKNPAFDQLNNDMPRQRPLPPVADHRCMKDCQKRGYNYMLCQKQCSYSVPSY